MSSRVQFSTSEVFYVSKLLCLLFPGKCFSSQTICQAILLFQYKSNFIKFNKFVVTPPKPEPSTSAIPKLNTMHEEVCSSHAYSHSV
jgi:hypothetical protein